MEIGTKTAKNQLKACSVIERLKIDRWSTYFKYTYVSQFINKRDS